MFGLGFWEIFLIIIVAIVALGPERLPTAMVDIAKFFKKVKNGLEDAKTTLDNELKLTEMKSEADKYKAQLDDLKRTMNVENIDAMIDNTIKTDTSKATSQASVEDGVVREKVTFKKTEPSVLEKTNA